MPECVRATVLTEVVAEALAEAEQVGMEGRVVAEWVSVRVLGSSRVPLRSHFPPEGGGPCPACGEYVTSPAGGRDEEKAQVWDAAVKATSAAWKDAVHWGDSSVTLPKNPYRVTPPERTE